MLKIVAGVIISLVFLFGASVVIASYQITSENDDGTKEHYTTSQVIFSALS